jgi:hypothetical protein
MDYLLHHNISTGSNMKAIRKGKRLDKKSGKGAEYLSKVLLIHWTVATGCNDLDGRTTRLDTVARQDGQLQPEIQGDHRT